MKTITIKVPNNPTMRRVLKAAAEQLGVAEHDYLHFLAISSERLGDDAKAAVFRNQAFDTRAFATAIADALRDAEDAGDEETLLRGLEYIGPPRKEGAP